MRTLCILLPLALCLAGCGPAADDPGAGGVTTQEAKALNEAAEMLDSRPPLVNTEEVAADLR